MAITTNKPEVHVKKILGPDFTVYQKRGSRTPLARYFETELRDFEAQNSGRRKYSHSAPVLIRSGKAKPLGGRALISSAYQGSILSITLRCNADSRPQLKEYEAAVKKKLSGWITSHAPGKSVRDLLGYYPKGYSKYEGCPSATPTNG